MNSTGREGQPGSADDPFAGLPLFETQLRIDALARTVVDVADALEQQPPSSPLEVRDAVVFPILRGLGWDVGDDRLVVRGLRTATGVADLALCRPARDPQVLVKIGALAETGDRAGSHAFEDCTLRAIQLAVSEDGRVWRLHFPAGRGSIGNREFARFDIVEDVRKEVAAAFDRYFAFHSAESGNGVREAARDYGERRLPAEGYAAWRRVLLGEEIRERFAREVAETIGVVPDRELTDTFVHGQVASVQWPADPPDPVPARRVAVGDRVWTYDSRSHEIVMHVVVDADPDCEQGEVSPGSAIGSALLGGAEGEERDVVRPNGEPGRIRIVLIGDRGRP